jgi:hypothetical protein
MTPPRRIEQPITPLAMIRQQREGSTENGDEIDPASGAIGADGSPDRNPLFAESATTSRAESRSRARARNQRPAQ